MGSNDAVWTEEYSGLTVEFHADYDPMNPRKAWENMGVIWADHRNYNLGDEKPDAGLGWDFTQCRHNYANDGKYGEGESIAAALLRTYPGVVVLPVYFHEYGATLSTGDPVRHVREIAEWGSPDGVVFCLPDVMFREMGGTVVNADLRERVAKNLRAEVEVYSAYSSGEVYGIVIRDPETGETIDSCWGFYGTEDTEQVAKEMAKDAAEMLAERRTEIGQAAAGLPLYSAA